MKTESEIHEYPWVVEFTAKEAKEIKALRDLGVNGALCSLITISRGTAGEFIAAWEEEHPERGHFDEYYEDSASELERRLDFINRSPERLREWADLRKRMPSERFSEEITRRQAFEIIATLWLPSEFHEDVGL